MGKANDQKKKKKGPKGKRARAKAKLDRHWGEEVPQQQQQQDASKNRSVLRGTSSRPSQLQPPPSFSTFNDDSLQDDDHSSDDKMEPQASESDSDENEPNNDETGMDKLLRSLPATRAETDNDTEDDDMSMTDSDNGNSSQSDSDLNDDTIVVAPRDTFRERFTRASPSTNAQISTTTNPTVIKHRLNKVWQVQSIGGTIPSFRRGYAKQILTTMNNVVDNDVPPPPLPILSKVHAAMIASLYHYADCLIPSTTSRTTTTNSILVQHLTRHLAQARTCLEHSRGYTRATILVLLPTRSCAFEFLQAFQKEMIHMDRWTREYGPVRIQDDDPRRANVLRQKGRHWNELFGDDKNDDDDFKIGISCGSSKWKLYVDFYKADMILASPLGLKLSRPDESRDYLSSIEICYLCRADVMLQQNWDHVTDVLQSCNQLPQNRNDTDFSKVRPYFLDNQSMHWRQLILETETTDPTLLSCFRKFAKSGDGQVKLRKTYTSVMDGMDVPVRQVFVRVPTDSVQSASDDRLNYFVKKVLPKLKPHTMIYVESYFDFVPLRNWLLEHERDFVSVTEYSRTSEISRGRARFLQGRQPLLLYTGRAHFFHRHHIKGVRHLVFFGLPSYPRFYVEHVNRIQTDDASPSTCLALFTKYDSHALERIVGTANCGRLIKGDKTTFLLFSAS